MTSLDSSNQKQKSSKNTNLPILKSSPYDEPNASPMAPPVSVPRSEKVIKMKIDDMCDREVNFLLKRRGITIIPGDINQAREMAKEQRAKVINVFFEDTGRWQVIQTMEI